MIALHARAFIAAATDAHGNPAPSYAAPVAWEVWGIAPGENLEPGTVRRSESDIVWTVYAPADDAVPGERDRVLVDGDEFEVEGRAADWTRGPWPHPTAGVVVSLKRVEG